MLILSYNIYNVNYEIKDKLGGKMDQIILWLERFFSVEWTVLIASSIPVIELRGSIPLGISLGLSPFYSFFLSMVGSMFPVPFLYFGIRPIFRLLMKQPFFEKHLGRLMEKTTSKSDQIVKYGFWGLLIFVAIPLPGTGVWTGTLAAVLLNMRFKIAFPALFLGDLGAGIIVTSLSMGVLKVFGL